MIEYNTEQKKIISYYNLMITSLHFYNYLYMDCFNRNDASPLDFIPKDNYNKIIITQCALMLSLYKDKFLLKNELNINETGLNLLLEPIIGLDATTEEKIEMLNKLRHKLLHGDYYMYGDNLFLNDSENEITININDLYNTCSSLMIVTETLKNEKNTRKIVAIKSDVIKKYGKIDTVEDFKKVIREFDILEFTDEPVKGYERTDKYTACLESFYQVLKNQTIYDNKSSYNRVEMIKSKYKKLFDQHHINLTFRQIKVENLKQYGILKKVYMEHKDYFDKLSVDEQYKDISYLIYTYAEEQYTNLFFGALLNNIELLNTYKNSIDADISKIKYKKMSVYYQDDMTIVAAINAFYGVYHYGLESILSKNLNLKQIVNNEIFDFSKLNIDIANDISMDKTLSSKRFVDEYQSIRNKITSMYNALQESKNKYQNYKTKAKKQNIESEKRLLNEIKQRKIEYDNAIDLEQKVKKFLENECHEFCLNYNIISHIRNAIAHGNVYIHPYEIGDTVNDRIIEFKDIHEGRLTYKLTIRFKDFIKLLNKENVDEILKYLNKITSPMVEEFIESEKVKSKPKKLIKSIFDKFKKNKYV